MNEVDRPRPPGTARPTIVVLGVVALLAIAVALLQSGNEDPVTRLAPDPGLRVEGETNVFIAEWQERPAPR